MEWDEGVLSRAARSCWGKYSRDDDGDWMPLHRHLSDTAAVAGRLWDTWVPQHVKSVAAGHLNEEQGRTLAMWLGAAHDLGKATPAFAVQVPVMRFRMEADGFRFGPIEGSGRSPHSIQSHLIVQDWLVARGFTADAAQALACVPGGHHGTAPEVSMLYGGESTLQRGDEQWRRVQTELADWVADMTGIGEVLPLLAQRPPLPQAQVLLTAVVVLSDWIASDADRFPFRDGSGTTERADRAWSTLHLPEPWRASPLDDDDELFRQRFDLPPQTAMYPVQQAVATAARGASGPELLIVEAPMGEGKTEAALLAAEILAQRNGSGGCFIALPTMATSDAMFRRVNGWVTRLGAGRTSIYLAHGKAALNKDFQGLVERDHLISVGDPGDSPRGRHDDGCGAGVTIAHEWLSGRKKGVLANFVVGTIDQILFSALRSRHLVLRHLAVAGKIVVIDEVHSSDDYMAVYLEKALYWLAAYGVPAVLLSATLSRARRHQLTDAYAGGMKVAQGRRPGRAVRRSRPVGHVEVEPPPVTDLEVLSYPVLTMVGQSGVRTTPVAASGRRLRVRLETMPDDMTSVVDLIGRAQVDGGVVAVVRNTVQRAQETAGVLQLAFPDVEVILVHSRFLAVDRAARERRLHERLGPPPGADRPQRMIVVGTQVLEQSLDVDFDLLVTDLAPVDLVLQRVGRLHRHDRSGFDRHGMVEPRCVLVGVQDWGTAPPTFDRGSEAVYGRAALLRAAGVLLHRAQSQGAIELPSDIPVLVDEATNPVIDVPDNWRPVFEEAEAKAALDHEAKVAGASIYVLDGLPRNDLVGWAGVSGNQDAENPRGRARVRDSDDGLEVLVAQQIEGRVHILPWIEITGSRELPLDDAPDPAVARALATCSLRLPRRLTHPGVIDRVIEELEGNGRAAWQRSKWLRGELFLFLDLNLSAEVAGQRLRYSRDAGLQVDG